MYFFFQKLTHTTTTKVNEDFKKTWPLFFICKLESSTSHFYSSSLTFMASQETSLLLLQIRVLEVSNMGYGVNIEAVMKTCGRLLDHALKASACLFFFVYLFCLRFSLKNPLIVKN
jgi:hypothetical protein